MKASSHASRPERRARRLSAIAPVPVSSGGGPGVVRDWHVVMVAGCNLRCAYCATDFGRFGGQGGVMNPLAGEHLAERIAAALDPESRKVTVSFGGGETFLEFNRFLALADRIRRRCRACGGRAQVRVATNGVLLDETRLRALARRRIGVSFSIDGPAATHDTARRDAAGRATFQTAFANWLRYRALVRRLPDPPACNIHCVFGAHSGSLTQVTQFWLDQGVPLLDIAAVNHSRFDSPGERQAVRRIRARFVKELREWALGQTRACALGDFLGRYRGPGVLFAGWQRLLAGREKMLCTPGRGMLAVGHDGALYPCEGYVGLRRYRIGDVFGGIDPQRVDRFVAACWRAEAVCAGCGLREACEKPCLALIATDSPLRNVRRACGFAQGVARATRDTFEMIVRKDAGGAP